MATLSQRLEFMFHNARLLGLFRRFGVSPFRGGLALCGGWTFLVLVVEGVAGRLTPAYVQAQGEGFIIEVAMAVLLGVFLFYVIAAIAAHEERTIKSINALRGLEEMPVDEFNQRVEKLGRFPLWRMITACAAGLLLGVAAPLTEYFIVGNYDAYTPALWPPEVYVHRIVGPLLGVAVSLLIHAIVSDSAQFWSLARRLRSVELTNLRRYAPFTEQGLTNAAIIMGFVSMFAFLAIVDRYLILVATVMAYGSFAALLGLLLPVWGLRARIKAEKEKEIRWCQDRILAAKTAMKANKQGATQELAGLLTYLRDVEGVNSWPVAPGGITRFGLFLLIPLGSWSGGAIVERLLDSIID